MSLFPCIFRLLNMYQWKIFNSRKLCLYFLLTSKMSVSVQIRIMSGHWEIISYFSLVNWVCCTKYTCTVKYPAHRKCYTKLRIILNDLTNLSQQRPCVWHDATLFTSAEEPECETHTCSLNPSGLRQGDHLSFYASEASQGQTVAPAPKQWTGEHFCFVFACSGAHAKSP